MRFNFKYLAYITVTFAFSFSIAGSYEDFFKALEADDARPVQQLIARGFDPNSRDEKGQVALFVALRAGSLRVADALISHPQLQVDLANEAGETPLMMAALRGHLAAAQALIQRGAAVKRVGWSPLLYAATGPEPRMVSLMLDHGAPIDGRSPNGSTPLMMAARYGSEGSVRLLLERGANPALKNDLGLTAADFARQAGREALAVQLSPSAPR